MASPEAAVSSVPTTGHPFDAVAASYDDDFSNRWLGRWYRGMVWQLYERSFSSGDHILELGCGTGDDACWLAGRGVAVTATDASAGMLAKAQAKAGAAGLSDHITFAELDLNRIRSTDDLWTQLPQQIELRPAFDGAISNFGPLNCVRDRRSLLGALAAVLKPGGRFIAVVMGPLCPWECAWHTARLEFRTATRRLRAAAPGNVGEGRTIPVWYPSMRRLESECRPHFEVVDRVGLGLLLPPSGMARLVDRSPRLFERLGTLDQRLSRTRPWHWLNDHYAMVLERRS